MKKTDSDHQPEGAEKEKLVEALVGPDEDFEDEECAEEYLTAFGIDPDTLVSEFKERLQERARQHQAESGSVPDALTNAMRAVRDQVKSSDPMNVDPDEHIDKLLAGELAKGASAGRFARSFRRKNGDEMCAEDDKIIDALEAELEEGDEKPAQ